MESVGDAGNRARRGRAGDGRETGARRMLRMERGDSALQNQGLTYSLAAAIRPALRAESAVADDMVKAADITTSLIRIA
jgi:hypothetical protein